MIDESRDTYGNSREQYARNMVRLAELDRQLAAYHRLRDALRAHRTDPCNVTWRGVLEALAAVETTNADGPVREVSR